MLEMKSTDLVVYTYQLNNLYEVTEGCYYIEGVNVRGVYALIIISVEFKSFVCYNKAYSM